MGVLRLVLSAGLLGILALSNNAFAQASGVCDAGLLEEQKTAFTELSALVSENPSTALQVELQAAAAEVVKHSSVCFAELYGGAASLTGPPILIDDGGVLLGGPSGFAPNGRKWGANSPFTPTSPPGSPGGTVTYSYMPAGVDMSAESADPNATLDSLAGFDVCWIAEINLGFSLWAAVADIDFVEVTDNGVDFDASGASGDIRIGSHTFDGPGGVLAHAFFPPPNGVSSAGDMHFDKEENWTCDTSGIDIGIVAIHEIGHSIGLNHESVNLAIMNPFYNPAVVSTIETDDINGAAAIYGGGIVSGGDPDDTIFEAGRTGYGVTTIGEIDSGTDVDVYGFEAYAGQVFEIDIDADPTGGPLLDSIIRIFDDTGTQLTLNDDAPGPAPEVFVFESFLSWTAPSDGTYYIGVSVFPNTSYDVLTGDGDSAGFNIGTYEMIIRPDVDLTNSLAAGGDRAGFGVAIDGDWTAVGVRLADDVETNGGAVDMYRHNGDGTWSFHSRIADTEISDQGRFGHSVALAGDLLLAGADGWTAGPGTGRSGNAHWYGYNSVSDTWEFLVRYCDTTSIGCTAPTFPGDSIGRSVDMDAGEIDGALSIVGVQNNDVSGANSGAAIAFEVFTSGSLFTDAFLVAPDGDAGDNFGNSVAVSSDLEIGGNEVAVVGAQRDEDPHGANSGSAYVFEFDRSVFEWSFVTKLVASDGQPQDFFGTDVDVTNGGDRIVVSARLTDDPGANNVGAVYVFTRNPDGSYSEVQIIQASDREAGDFFGTSLALDGDRLVVGTYRRDEFGEDSGKAYSYLWNSIAGEFEEVAQLFNDDTTTRDEFTGRGNGIAIDDHNAVLGSWLDNRPVNNTGGAYGFGL